MQKVIFDAELRAKLHGLTEPIELCDEQGRTIGFVTPHDDFVRETYEWAKTAFTDSELDEARQQTGGRTLAEIKKSWGWA